MVWIDRFLASNRAFNFDFDFVALLRARKVSRSLCDVLNRSELFFHIGGKAALTSIEVQDFCVARNISTSFDGDKLNLHSSGRDDLRKLSESIERRAEPVFYWKHSSGTSGVPLHIPYSEFFHYLDSLCLPRWLEAAARLHDDGDVKNVACVSVRNGRQQNIVCAEPWDNGRLVAKVGVDERSPKTLDAVLKFIENVRPKMLVTKTALLEALAWRAERQNWPRINWPRLIVTSGAVLSKRLRKYILDVTGVEVFDVYATSELGVVGYRCNLCLEFHLDQSRCLIEEDDSGRLYASMILNEQMPVINYRVCDIRKTNKKCIHGTGSYTVLRNKRCELIRFSDGSCLDTSRIKIGKSLQKNIGEVRWDFDGKVIYCTLGQTSDDPIREEDLEKIEREIQSVLPLSNNSILVSISVSGQCSPGLQD